MIYDANLAVGGGCLSRVNHGIFDKMMIMNVVSLSLSADVSRSGR